MSELDPVPVPAPVGQVFETPADLPPQWETVGQPPPPVTVPPSLTQTVEAAWSLYSTPGVGVLHAPTLATNSFPQEGYAYTDWMPSEFKGTPMEQRFAETVNAEQGDALGNQVVKELYYKQLLQDSATVPTVMAMVVAGVADPINLLGVGAWAAKAVQMTRAAALAVKSAGVAAHVAAPATVLGRIAETTAVGAVAGVMGTLITEPVLSTGLETRTANDAVNDVIVTGLLGAGLGMLGRGGLEAWKLHQEGVGGLPPLEHSLQLRRDMTADLANGGISPSPTTLQTLRTTGGDAGAALFSKTWVTERLGQTAVDKHLAEFSATRAAAVPEGERAALEATGMTPAEATVAMEAMSDAAVLAKFGATHPAEFLEAKAWQAVEESRWGSNWMARSLLSGLRLFNAGVAPVDLPPMAELASQLLGGRAGIRTRGEGMRPVTVEDKIALASARFQQTYMAPMDAQFLKYLEEMGKPGGFRTSITSRLKGELAAAPLRRSTYDRMVMEEVVSPGGNPSKAVQQSADVYRKFRSDMVDQLESAHVITTETAASFRANPNDINRHYAVDALTHDAQLATEFQDLLFQHSMSRRADAVTELPNAEKAIKTEKFHLKRAESQHKKALAEEQKLVSAAEAKSDVEVSTSWPKGKPKDTPEYAAALMQGRAAAKHKIVYPVGAVSKAGFQPPTPTKVQNAAKAAKLSRDSLEELEDTVKDLKGLLAKTDDQLVDHARNTYMDILQLPGGRLPFGEAETRALGATSPPTWDAKRVSELRRRTMGMSTEELLPFLDPSIVAHMGEYHRKISKSLALDEALNAFGARNMDDLFRIMREDKSNTAAQVDVAERHLLALRDNVMGTPPQGGEMSSLSSTRALNAVDATLTHQMRGIIGSLADPLLILVRQNVVHSFRSGYVPLMVDLLTTVKNNTLRDLGKAELRELAIAVDQTISESAQRHSYDAVNGVSSGSWAERAYLQTAKQFHFATGIQGWTVLWRNVSINITVRELDRVAQAVASGKASPRQLAYARELGLDESRLLAIDAQVQQHSPGVRSGARLSGWSSWADEELKQAYRAAIHRQTTVDIQTPGAEIPAVLRNSPAVRVLGKFMTWNLAATHRVLLPAIESKDWLFILKTAPAVTLSAMGAMISDLENGRDINEHSLWHYVGRGYDAAGVLGVTSSTTLGLASIFDPQRQASRHPLSAVSSTLDSFSRAGNEAIKGIREGELTWERARRMAAVLTYHNVTGPGFIVNALQ